MSEKSAKSIFKRGLIILILTSTAAILIYRVYHLEPLKNNRLFLFPNRIQGWIGKELPMEPWVYESLETSFAIMRDYQSPGGDSVNLAIVWYDDKEIAFHSPEACLGGVGNRVNAISEYLLSVAQRGQTQVGRIIADNDRNKLMVLYYYITDGFITANQIDLRKEVLGKRLKMKRSSAAFIRLLMPIAGSSERSQSILEEFLRLSLPLIDDYTDTEKASSNLAPSK